jgi:hypothetical protein
MKLVPTKNYKKLYKNLKKRTASIPITIEMKNINYYDCLDCEHVEITNDSVISTTNISLPNDIINKILDFIPINVRLSILKSKYNKKFLKNKLENINVEKLYKCALLAEKIYHESLLHYSNIKYDYIKINNLNSTKINKYSYYKEEFMKIILLAIKHHRKIYKKKKIINSFLTRLRRIGTDHYGMNIYVLNKILKKEVCYVSYKGIPKFEKLLFKMYSQLLLM